jgi:aspartyl-tRNA(Asn)/glutamyl-tRNA(Gln) amidotransferase subunit C
MNKEEIKHLGTLARIELTDTEVDNFTKEISAILDYVSTIQEIVDDTGEVAPEFGPRYNVFRKDVVSNEPDSYTKDILANMPKQKDRYLVVKKILNTDSN